MTGVKNISGELPDDAYWDARLQRNVVKLLPGEFHVGTGDEMIVTVLGSCIAACLYECVLGVGGMNHFMLPYEKSMAKKTDLGVTDFNSPVARYGNIAMELLITEIIKIGGKRSNLQAKIFGGARITDTSMDIGAGNISFVQQYLQLEDIELVSQDVGGSLPRKVYCDSSSNKVLVKKIEPSTRNAIVVRENSYLADLKKRPMTGDICFL